MVGGNTGRWEWLEQQTAVVFLITGILFAAVAVYKGFHGFTSWSVPMEFDIIVGGFALIAPAVGLLGLYPRVRRAAPRVSKIAIGAAAVGGIVAFGVIAWFLLATLQMGRFPVWDEAPVWTAAALVVVFITLALGFLLFGVVGLQTSVLSRNMSLLLFVPAVLWLSLLVNVAVRAIPNLDFFVYVVDAAVVLVIAYLLRTEASPKDHAEPAADTTV